ncbi:MAG: 30S ribosomal protein S20 [Eubacteriales bacterium]
MPNIKSAKKRVLVIEKKSKQNKMIRSSVKTEIKKIDALLKEGKVAEAKAQLSEAFKMIDSAASKGVLHRNNASNKKSKLSIRVAAAEKAVSAKAE